MDRMVAIDMRQEPVPTTTCHLRVTTMRRIKSYAEYGDSVDSVLSRILDEYDKLCEQASRPQAVGARS
jgi:hypothetical protein